MYNWVYALAVDGSGNVYAGGYFTTAGVRAASYIAKWNGISWSALGSGLNSSVSALAVDGSGNVYAGGGFTTAGVSTANRIAKWNGSSWSALGSGMNNWVNALAVDGSGNVYAGGVFTTAGGKVGYAAEATIPKVTSGILFSGQLLTGGNVRLSMLGLAGTNYALDRTFNLLPPAGWVPQVTNPADANGVLVFTNAPNMGTNNFWRIRSVP
jgi:hypothetical protein